MNFDDIYKHSVYANVYSYVSKRNELKRKSSQKSSMLNYYALEIADDTEELYNIIADTYLNSPNSYKHNDILNDTQLLPLYAFYRVLVHQNFKMANNQSKVIDTYCKIMGLDYSAHLLCNNHIKQTELTNAVGLSSTKVGYFWDSYFKLIFENKTVSQSVNAIAKLYSSIVVNFTLIGEFSTVNVTEECSEFTYLLCLHLTQIEQKYSYIPENINEINITKQLKFLENELIALQPYDGNYGMDWTKLLDYYLLSIFRELVKEVKLTANKIKILTVALNLCDLDGIISPTNLISVTDYDTENLLSTLYNHFLVMVTGLYQKANRDLEASNFSETVLNLSDCIEKEIIKTTGITDIRGKSNAIMVKQLGLIVTALENGY